MNDRKTLGLVAVGLVFLVVAFVATALYLFQWMGPLVTYTAAVPAR